MFCVAGLGNPGERYSWSRHNLGFRVADALAEAGSTRIRRREFQALTATVRIGRSEVLLMKPQTYMNLSGRSLRAACQALAVPPERTIVVYDEVDLPAGWLRVRRGGGTAGHQGVESVATELGTNDFLRVRLGVGRPPEGIDTADYVLSEIAAGERDAASELVERAARAVTEMIINGVEAAMNKFNAPPATATE